MSPLAPRHSSVPHAQSWGAPELPALPRRAPPPPGRAAAAACTSRNAMGAASHGRGQGVPRACTTPSPPQAHPGPGAGAAGRGGGPGEVADRREEAAAAASRGGRGRKGQRRGRTGMRWDEASLRGAALPPRDGRAAKKINSKTVKRPVAPKSRQPFNMDRHLPWPER